MDTILIGTMAVALIISTITDIKTREVPDWISYSLIISAFGVRALFAAEAFEPIIIVEGIIGFTIFAAVGYAMYYTGQWGGGDSKLLMGLGAAIGLRIPVSDIPILGLFLLNMFLAGALYGITWIIVLAIHHRKKVIKHFQSVIKGKIHTTFLIMTALSIVMVFIFGPTGVGRLLFVVLVTIPLISLYTFAFVKVVEKTAFIKHISPEHLTEGDWIAEKVVVEGKIIAEPKDLGVSKDQIKKLVVLYNHHKIGKVVLKQGIPFVPSFLIGFMMTYTIGTGFISMLV